MKQRILAILMTFVLGLSLAGCGGSGQNVDGDSREENSGASQNGKEDEETGNDGEEDEETGSGDEAVYVTEPVTITLWHTRGAGANGTEMDRVVAEFNETNEYGITVQAEYIGSYSAIMPKTLTSIASGNNPVLVMSSPQNMATLITKDALADLTPFIERDGFDMDNFPEVLAPYIYYEDEIVSLPYLVSTSILIYNKDLFQQAGVSVPTTIEELEEIGPTIYSETGVQAFGMPIDPTYMQDALLRSLGGVGIIDEDGVTTSCLTNGSFVQLADDWRSWIEAGWCKSPNITSEATDLLETFYQGNLASFLVSSGSLQNVLEQCQGTINMGVAYMPGYSKAATAIGGANIAVIGRNHNQQEIAAAWEFLKFLMADEQLAQNAINTGYLPVTASSAASELIQSYWEEQPETKVAYEQMEWASLTPFSIYTSEWFDQMTSAFSYVVQAQNMTGEEAAEYLQKQYNSIFE